MYAQLHGQLGSDMSVCAGKGAWNSPPGPQYTQCRVLKSPACSRALDGPWPSRCRQSNATGCCALWVNRCVMNTSNPSSRSSVSCCDQVPGGTCIKGRGLTDGPKNLQPLNP